MLMSLQPSPWPEPAPEGAAAVRATYRRRQPPRPVGIRGRRGELFPDGQFAAAFGVRGRPGWSPGRLALVTVLQMAENLTDRQAAEAVRDKISWKYALGLGLDDEGFDASVLSEFRTRVVEHGLEQRALDLLLSALVAHGLLGPGGRARTDSTHVICAVRDLNRLELAGESVRAAAEALAAAAPDWLARGIDVADWAARYGARIDSWRLPASASRRAELAAAYGRDAVRLLRAVYDPRAPAWLHELPAIDLLRRVLVQHYLITADAHGREVVRMREAEVDGLPPGRARISSPYDPDARWAAKGEELFWHGYKVHLTETCGDPATDGEATGGEGPGGAERPNLIIGVTTTDATVPDAKVTEPIHAALADRALLPAEHLVDAGYPSAAGVLEAARRWGDHAGQPAGIRSLPPGEGRRRLRPGRLRHRLRRAAGDLPAGADQRPVASGHPARCRRHRDPVRRRHLPPLPGPAPVHPLDLTKARPSAHRATPRRPPGPTGRPRRADQRRLAGPLRRPGRCRGHHQPGRRDHRDAPRPLPRAAQDQAATRVRPGRAQPDPPGRLLERTPAGTDPNQPPVPPERRPGRLTNKPAGSP